MTPKPCTKITFLHPGSRRMFLTPPGPIWASFGLPFGPHFGSILLHLGYFYKGLCLNPFKYAVLYGMCLKPKRGDHTSPPGCQRPGKGSKLQYSMSKSDTSRPPVNIAKMYLKAPLAAKGQENVPNSHILRLNWTLQDPLSKLRKLPQTPSWPPRARKEPVAV